MIKKTEHDFFNLKIQEISKKVQALETHKLGQKVQTSSNQHHSV